MKKVFIAIGNFFKWIWFKIIAFFKWIFRIKTGDKKTKSVPLGGRKRSFEYGLHRTKKKFWREDIKCPKHKEGF